MDRDIINRIIEIEGEKLKVLTKVVEKGTLDTFDSLMEGKLRDLSNVRYEKSTLEQQLKLLKVEKPEVDDDEFNKVKQIIEWLEEEKAKEQIQLRLKNTEKNLARLEEDVFQLEKVKEEIDKKQKGEGSKDSKKSDS